jgi:glycosyltransferase involved in cell wall biosynthesis
MRGHALIDTVAVVIPAHDEEDLLGECLESIRIASRTARGLVGEVRVRVVLDACADRSALIAASHRMRTVSIAAHRVGAARRAGVADALRGLDASRLDRVWTAHTDADSVVPPHWLAHQIALANTGAHAVVGTVRPNFADLSPAQIAAWTATHTPGVANGHVHGANLGVRADWLARVGGFKNISEHEDVRLVASLRSAGAVIVPSDEAWVLTSGRLRGRTPGGYARHLREDLVPAHPPLDAITT